MLSNNNYPGRQAGMTLIGWLLVFIFIAFAALIAMRLVPVYMESASVGTVLDSVAQDRSISAENRAEVMSTIRKRLNINDVDNVKRENIKFERVSGGLEVTIEYEARVDLVGNLDAVASFKKQALIRN